MLTMPQKQSMTCLSRHNINASIPPQPQNKKTHKYA
jgi:hypothetical protein